MTWYLAIGMTQEPFDVGLDDVKRAQFSFNVIATKRPSATFLADLVAVLVAAGVGQEDVSIFSGAKAVIPNGPGPFLSIRSTGGTSPMGTHDGGAGAYRRPGAMIISRASTSAAAEAKALEAYAALQAVRNRDVNP